MWRRGPIIALGLLAGAQLLLAQGEDAIRAEAKSAWERSAAAGLTLTEGNSDTLVLHGDIQANREWPDRELKLGADGTYGELEGEKSSESIHGFIQYNELFTERFYGYARLDALHDAIADVDYRFTLSPGVGYYILKNERTKLNVEAGPAFIYEKQGGEEDAYAALRLSESFEYQLSERSKLWQKLEFLPQVDDLENFIINAEIGVESVLTDRFSIRAVLQDTFDNQPAPGRQENDVKLITSLAYSF